MVRTPSLAAGDSFPALVDKRIDASLDAWVDFYKTCHAAPELSLEEKESAARIAKAFRAAGLDVAEHVGGHGVVGVAKNGTGPVLLIRGDMDALPVKEQTGLAYASKVEQTGSDGVNSGVMHACGHDVHMTVLVATAETLMATKDQWSGTIVFVAQPAEEIGQGARLMLEDGLYERFPKPDYALALHVSHEMPAGTVGYTAGWSLANVDSVDITIHGKGGHGAYPQQTVDPVVAAAQVVMALQTIVSRRIDPRDTAVVTIGSIHGGTKHNVIPDTVSLQLTVRSYTDETRKLLLDSIRQIATDVCKAAGCPKPPDVTVIETDFTPAEYNDPALTSDCVKVFESLVGGKNVLERRPSMGGEDFSRYAREGKNIRAFMFWLGSVGSDRFEAASKPGGEPLPSIHSAFYWPDPKPTIRTGVRCMAGAAQHLLKKEH